jgi:integrase
MASGKLSNLKIAKLNKPTLVGDGDGLWLFVRALKDGGLSKRWAFRYRRSGRYFEVPLGPYPDVSLADARASASGHRAALARGDNPAAERKANRASHGVTVGSLTFRQATHDYLEVERVKWRARDTAEDWIRTFDLYLFPALGARPIAEIDDAAARTALAPVFARSADLGWRTARRAAAVYARARALKLTSGVNPFEKRGNLAYLFPAKPAHTHRAAIPYQQLPALYLALEARGNDPVALATRLMLALALRPGEARSARWGMLNEAEATITFTMTKNGKAFRAPLSAAALAVIEQCRAIRNGEWLFPGARQSGPIHATAILDLVKALTDGATAHGVSRSSFADFCYTTEAANPATIETALNHSIGNATQKAYFRGDLLEARRVLMEKYSAYLTGASGVVVAFPLIRSS